MKRSVSIMVALVTLAVHGALGAQTVEKPAQAAADNPYDVALHELHAKTVEQQVKAAEAFAAELMKRAAAQNLDLTSFVKDAQYLADADTPAAPEQAAKLEEAHRETLNGVESVLGLPGLFGTLRGGSTQPAAPLSLAAPAPAVGGCGCSKLVIDPPFRGSFHQNFPLGAIANSPYPVSALSAAFRSGVIGAGHQVASTGASFTAPAGVRTVSASATMDLSADVGVGGLGLAHGWSDVQFVVKDVATGAEMCRSSRLETANRATGAWYWRDTPDLGEQTIGCSFVRAPGVAADYKASIELRAYGTYAGLAGGHSVVRARFKRIDVVLCP